jgi:hypothetical protein
VCFIKVSPVPLQAFIALKRHESVCRDREGKYNISNVYKNQGTVAYVITAISKLSDVQGLGEIAPLILSLEITWR